MKLHVVPRARGLVWALDSFRVFARQPLAFAAVLAACLFVLVLFGVVPVLGRLAPLVLSPYGTLLFMMATRLALQGKPLVPAAFAEMLGAGRRTLVELLKMGLAYAAASVAAFWLCGLIDGGAVDAMMKALGNPKSTPDMAAVQMADPRVQLGVALRLSFAALLSIPFWHAPALVHWGGQGWAKALFFSSVAVWRNRGAFTVYGLAWTAIWLLTSMLAAIGLALFGPQGLVLVATPLTLGLLTLLYASLYFTFSGCFSDEAKEADRTVVDTA